MTTLDMRLSQRDRPIGRPVMFQSWRSLTFLHWKVPPAEIQRLLPPGLTVDTFDGSAYVGLVPFTMHSIRLSALPALPGVSASHETNVRTYVVDENGVPGVWFFSLDAVNPVFVATARVWYGLPYYRARMKVTAWDVGAAYESRRPGLSGPSCRTEIGFSGIPCPAEAGTLEFFLAERYVLFSHFRSRLWSGRVWHKPYPLLGGSCLSMEEDLLKVAQIGRSDAEPLVHFSPGVDVDVFGLRRV